MGKVGKKGTLCGIQSQGRRCGRAHMKPRVQASQAEGGASGKKGAQLVPAVCVRVLRSVSAVATPTDFLCAGIAAETAVSTAIRANSRARIH